MIARLAAPLTPAKPHTSYADAPATPRVLAAAAAADYIGRMRTLILLRHGEAERRAASGRDLDRALTAQGLADARAAGVALRRAGLAPDAALVSSALRTRQTWAAVAEALDCTLRAPVGDGRPDLYDAPAEDLLAAALACEGEVVALVAHNPGIGELAAQLSGEAARFPPAALAVFRWEAGAPRLVLRRDPAEAPA